ncbi:MAG: MOSC domain-containing protein [Campylobacterota bacterium]|nr:MOSC domain-containing protein [Campylobacterota bacterium]
MKKTLGVNGEVLKLFISKKGEEQRVTMREIEVDENGVVGDKFYGKDPSRSILITALDSYILAKEEGIDMAYGSLGENILMECSPYHLSVGTHFKIGEVILEITQNCTLCNSLAKVDKKLPKLLKNDRGIFAKVVKEGTICISNRVKNDI